MIFRMSPTPMRAVVASGPHAGRVVDIDREISVGRGQPSDLQLDDPRVSARHAVLRPGDRGAVLEDVGSSNGSFVNGVQVTAPHELCAGDEVRFGDTTLVIEQTPAPALTTTAAWSLAVRTGPDAGSGTAVGEGQSVLIGRDPGAGLVLTDSRVSNRHAEIWMRGGVLGIRDLGSANGTLVDGAPVRGTASLGSGAEIQVGETVIVAGPGSTVGSGPTPTVIGQVPAELAAPTPVKGGGARTLAASLLAALIVAGGSVAGYLVLRDENSSLTPAEVVRANRNATAMILSRQNGELSSSGSGFVIDAEQGLIVTNNHVATGGELSVQAEAARETPVGATIVAAMPCDDLALIKIDDSTVKQKTRAVTFSSTPYEQGDPVVALGYPGSAESGSEFGKDTLSATSGIVSKVEARYDVPLSGVPLLTSVVQHSAAVNPGNSGGPLFDDRGELIGVNTAIFGTAGGRAENESYAVSEKRLKERIDALKRGESTHWLGISLGSAARTTDDAPPVGIFIQGVTPGSPADRAGIRAGTVLVGVNNQRIVDAQSYCTAVPEKEGSSVTATIFVPGSSGPVDLPLQVGNGG